MTLVVCLAAIVTKELEEVVGSKMLRVVLHKLLCAIPESGDGLTVLVETQDETVLLLLLDHDAEGVVVNIAEKLDGGLDTPVVFVVKHQWVAEEESRLKATHVTVAHRVAIDDLPGLHILTDLLGLVLVDPFGEGPVLLGNLAIVGFSGCQGCCNLLECVIKGLVVKEDPVVIIAAVETILDLSNGLGNIPNIAVASQSNKCSIHTRTRCHLHQVIPARVTGGHGHWELLAGLVDACLGRGLMRNSRFLGTGRSAITFWLN